MDPATEQSTKKTGKGDRRRTAKKKQILLVFSAAAFALCWGIPKALYSRDLGIVWLIFVAGVCGAWFIMRARRPGNSEK